MSRDPLFDRLRRLPVPAPDAAAKGRALHRSLAALGQAPSGASPSVPASWAASWAWRTALPVLLACLALLAWIGTTERRHAEDTAALRLVLGQMEATFQNQLAAVVLTDDGAKVVLSKDAPPPSSRAVLLTLRGGGTTTRIVTFSGRWFDLPVNGTTVHVQVMETGAGRFVLAGDGFFWDGSSKAVDGLRIRGRFL